MKYLHMMVFLLLYLKRTWERTGRKNHTFPGFEGSKEAGEGISESHGLVAQPSGFEISTESWDKY